MRISTLAATVALSALMATGAVAADVYTGDKSLKDDANYVQGTVVNWSGLYVGGQAGGGILRAGPEDSEIGISVDYFVGGGTVGYDFAFGRFLIGPFAQYNFIGSDILEDAVDSEWAAGVRAGVLVAPRTLLYGSLAYTQPLGDASFVDDIDGIRAGVGVELAITGNLFATGEINHTWYDLPDGVNGIDLDDTRALAGLKLKFNDGLFGRR